MSTTTITLSSDELLELRCSLLLMRQHYAETIALFDGDDDVDRLMRESCKRDRDLGERLLHKIGCSAAHIAAHDDAVAQQAAKANTRAGEARQ